MTAVMTLCSVSALAICLLVARPAKRRLFSFNRTSVG
jgi:hypothetical protein